MPYLSPGVYVEEMEAGSRPIEGVGTAIAAFVGLAERGPVNAPTLVTNWTQFTTTFGEFVDGAYLAHAVYGYFANGGGSCYVVRVGGAEPEPAARSGNGGATPGTGTATGAATAMIGSYPVQAREPGEAGNHIEVVVEPGEADGAAPEEFRLVVRAPDQPEESFSVSTRRGKNNIVGVVNTQSKLISVREAGPSPRLEPGTVTLAGGAAPARTGDGAVAVRPDDYVGDAADRTGFAGLEAIDEVTILCVPDLLSSYQSGQIDVDGVKAVHLAMISHCELMGDRVAILDPPPGLSAQQIRQWRTEVANYDSKQAALYWPWVKVLNPARGEPMLMPPSGHVAGVWGRNDDTRGVHKAPANEVLRGVLAPELMLTGAEQDLLNPVGINCIRSFSGRGIRIWGARTLASDPAWRYLNIRRLFNYLEESILAGTQWAVFEPNDVALWAKLRRTISAFLVTEWRRGALFGLTPDEAFYVKCDAETNVAETIDAGQVICEIGVAPVKPAEFVVFRLAQFSGGTSVVSE